MSPTAKSGMAIILAKVMPTQTRRGRTFQFGPENSARECGSLGVCAARERSCVRRVGVRRVCVSARGGVAENEDGVGRGRASL